MTIEQALAEALHGDGDDGCNGPLDKCDIQGQFIEEATAILATEPMQATQRVHALADQLAEALRWCYQWEQKQSYGQWSDERTMSIATILAAYEEARK